MKWLRRILLAIGIILFACLILFYLRTKDRHPGYSLDITHQTSVPSELKLGFSAFSVTPEVPDTWTDKNGDARYNEKDGDSYADVNGNGQFDAVWMAGFQNRRPAMGIHDTLWTRTMVVDDGEFVLAWVAVDAIGFGNDDVILVRKQLSNLEEVDYVIISSTHTHEGPDLIGLWGDSEYRNGVDPSYRKFVIDQCALSVRHAFESRESAILTFGQDLTGASSLVTDSRHPIILDHGVRVIHARSTSSSETLGSVVSWANHPETLWNKNLLLSSDFPHFVRDGVENGVWNGDTLVQPGVGGIALYVNGSIGGLMTTLPEFGIPDPFRDTIYREPGFAKTEAQGKTIAMLALQALGDTAQAMEIESAALGVRARTVTLPLKNSLFRLAVTIGTLDRGMSGWWKMRSEVAWWSLGPAEFLHHPAEIYPEIINGGVETPEGQDFDMAPYEQPPIRSLMKGRYKFVTGLSNDMIGYVIPKSQWDEDPPYTYGYEEAPYGEIMSLGPDTAPLIYNYLSQILTE